ncbi:sigma-70 family RNA polymerase sigma factor [Pelagerythrobacter sp.]|uniref:sigma-70 family RNA polymerase sigma factor n=1 Tax=Pelagerythrobacter sp. TaxID=2800702 RepID=UPI0035B350A0
MKLDHSHFSAAEAYREPVGDRVTRFLPMVRKLAWHLSGSGGPTIDVEDLMQAGLVALTECAQRHDSPSDDGFAAYAKLRVRGAMVDLLRSASPDPRGARARRRMIEDMKTKLHGELGREPSAAELGEGLGMSTNDYLRLESELAETRIASIDECYSETDVAFASEEPDAERQVLQREDRESLIAAIGSLGDRHQLVIQLYFVEELNLSEIAAVLSVSVPRVHQLKAAALAQMRKALAAIDMN